MKLKQWRWIHPLMRCAARSLMLIQLLHSLSYRVNVPSCRHWPLTGTENKAAKSKLKENVVTETYVRADFCWFAN